MIIMYHHIHDKTYRYHRLGHLPVSNFEKQLSFLKKTYGQAVNINDYSSKSALSVLLTFDDGLKSHIEYVAPSLIKYGFRGTFFVCSYPYLERRVCNVHLLHLILGYVPLERLVSALPSDVLKDESISSSYRSQRSGVFTKKLKTYVNYQGDHAFIRDFLLKIWKRETGINESSLVDELYLSQNDLIALQSNGHTVLPHMHSHRLLTRLSSYELSREFSESIVFFEDILRTPMNCICVPYGGGKSWNAECHRYAIEHGVKKVILVDSISSICEENLTGIEYFDRTDCSQLVYAKYVE